MLQDLKLIIEGMPELMASKSHDASLFLFALYTGARKITAANVLLKDILSVDRVLTPAPKTIVRINQRVTKGDAHFNQG